ncbi:MAG TPA: peptidoglycan-binding protein, partial [Beijerinckiaceae bacterium]|nr:peptidoglycan-binding protein [Beijerinckiaceae bacterium]
AQYGYGIAPSGLFDAATAAVVTAFQRHFRPQRVDGLADASTIATLRDLLAALRCRRHDEELTRSGSANRRKWRRWIA